MGALPPLVAYMTADIQGFQAKMGTVKAEMAGIEGAGNKAFGGLASVGKVAFLGIAAAAVGGTSLALKMAGDFQQSMTQLVTGAGESRLAIDTVSKGVLQMAGETGTSAVDLSKGLYLVESAGFHGASGLTLLKAAAEGAKVGSADLMTTADALSTVINAYHLNVGDATKVTNEMIATVAAGKMHLSDLTGSLSAVLPVASAVKLDFSEVGGAIATMTAQGMSAQQATQDLANTISSLSNPNAVATKEMAMMGLSSVDVSKNLGKRGLTGTISEMTGAILSHMGPSGLVMQNTFNQSKAAAADANTMLKALPPSLQAIATKFQEGTITSAEWRKELKSLSPEHRALAQEFAKTEINAHSFNDLLKSGSAQAQTYNAALSDMLGGQTGLNVGLMLGNDNAATFQKNVNSVAAAARGSGKEVTGWALTQRDLNQRVSQTVEGLKAFAIQVGTVMIPVVLKAMDTVSAWSGWLSKHRDIVTAVASAVGTVLVIAIGAYTVSMASAAVATIAATWPLIAIIAVIAGVAYGLSMAYQHVKWFHDAVNAVGGFIQGTLMPIFGTLINVYIKVMGAAFSALGETIGFLWNTFIGFIGWIGSTLKPALDGVSSVFKTVGDAMNAINPFAKHSPSLVENVQAGVEAIKGHYASLSGMQLKGPSIGGISAGSSSLGMGSAGLGGQAGGGGMGAVTINIQGYNKDPQALAIEVRDQLLRLKRSTGNLGLA